MTPTFTIYQASALYEDFYVKTFATMLTLSAWLGQECKASTKRSIRLYARISHAYVGELVPLGCACARSWLVDMQRQAARLMRHPTRDFHDVVLYDQNGLLTPWGFGYYGSIGGSIRSTFTQDVNRALVTRLGQANKIYMEWDDADEYATQTRNMLFPQVCHVASNTLVVKDKDLDYVPLELAALRHKYELQAVHILYSRRKQLDLELVGRLRVTRCVLQGVWPLDINSLRNITHLELADMHVFPGMRVLTILHTLVLSNTNFGALDLVGLKLVKLHVIRSNVCLYNLFGVLADMTSLKELCILRTRTDSDTYVQASSLSKLVKLTNLEHLELDDNLLSGSLPADLVMLAKLETLIVYEDDDNQRFDRRVCQEILDMKLVTLCIT